MSGLLLCCLGSSSEDDDEEKDALETKSDSSTNDTRLSGLRRFSKDLERFNIPEDASSGRLLLSQPSRPESTRLGGTSGASSHNFC